MPLYKVFFYGSLFFMTGIFFKSINLSSFMILAVFFAAFIFFLAFLKTKRKDFLWLIFLLPVVLAGAVYYQWDNERFLNQKIIFEKEISFEGVVSSYPLNKGGAQEFKLSLFPPYKGNLLIRASIYPSVDYGDRLVVRGVVRKPFSAGYEMYLAKNRISGLVYFPEIKRLGGSGLTFKGFLFKIRARITEAFDMTLPPLKSAFLSGLTMGGYGGLPPEFIEAMNLSGTTHLVALSGYNISILAGTALATFLFFFRRKTAFVLTILTVVGFVIMTGAEASVVRAAVMGLLVIIAAQIGRVYDIRNALVLAGLLMVLENPKVLVFDVGFQLSFIALLGIVYLKPVLQGLLKMKKEPGFFAWRENLLITASAQLAVAPILIINFGRFSLTSLLANTAILELIPLTMGLGFILAFLSFFSYYLSLVIGWIVGVLLAVEIGIIKLFSVLSVLINPQLGWGGAVVYYVLLLILLFKFKKYIYV